MLLIVLVAGFTVGWVRGTWFWLRTSFSHLRNMLVLKRRRTVLEPAPSSGPSMSAGSTLQRGASVMMRFNSLYRNRNQSMRVKGAGMGANSAAAAAAAVARVEDGLNDSPPASTTGRGWRGMRRQGESTVGRQSEPAARTASTSFLRPQVDIKSSAHLGHGRPIGEGQEESPLGPRDISGLSNDNLSLPGALAFMAAGLENARKRNTGPGPDTATGSDPRPDRSTGSVAGRHGSELWRGIMQKHRGSMPRRASITLHDEGEDDHTSEEIQASAHSRDLAPRGKFASMKAR